MGISSLLLLIGASACTWVASQAAESAIDVSGDLRALSADIRELEKDDEPIVNFPTNEVMSGSSEYCPWTYETPAEMLNDKGGVKNSDYNFKVPTKCCPEGSYPHKRDENHNFVDHTALEDAFAYSIFKEETKVPAKDGKPGCPNLIDLMKGLVDDVQKLCPVVANSEKKTVGLDGKQRKATADGVSAENWAIKGSKSCELDCKLGYKEEGKQPLDSTTTGQQIRALGGCDFTYKGNADSIDCESAETKVNSMKQNAQSWVDRQKESIKEAIKKIEDKGEGQDTVTECVDLFKMFNQAPPAFYKYLDMTYPESLWGFKGEHWQAWLQGKNAVFQKVIFNQYTEEGGEGQIQWVQKFVGDDAANGAESYELKIEPNGAKKGRTNFGNAPTWYKAYIGGGKPGESRPEPEGGVTSSFFQCKLPTVDMKYANRGFPTSNDPKWEFNPESDGADWDSPMPPGKSQFVPGEFGPSKIFAACQAPYGAGLSGTIAHQARAVRGAGQALTTKHFLILIATIVLGGHHTLTEAAVPAAMFDEFQTLADSVDASAMPGTGDKPYAYVTGGNPSDPSDLCNDGACKAKQTEVGPPSNGLEYKRFVGRMLKIGDKEYADFATTFDETLGGTGLQNFAALTDSCGNIGDLKFNKAILPFVPFWVDGTKLTGRTSSCVDLLDFDPTKLSAAKKVCSDIKGGGSKGPTVDDCSAVGCYYIKKEGKGKCVFEPDVTKWSAESQSAVEHPSVQPPTELRPGSPPKAKAVKTSNRFDALSEE